MRRSARTARTSRPHRGLCARAVKTPFGAPDCPLLKSPPARLVPLYSSLADGRHFLRRAEDSMRSDARSETRRYSAKAIWRRLLRTRSREFFGDSSRVCSLFSLDRYAGVVPGRGNWEGGADRRKKEGNRGRIEAEMCGLRGKAISPPSSCHLHEISLVSFTVGIVDSTLSFLPLPPQPLDPGARPRRPHPLSTASSAA